MFQRCIICNWNYTREIARVLQSHTAWLIKYRHLMGFSSPAGNLNFGRRFSDSHKKFRNFWNRRKWWKNYLKKFPENPEIDKNVGNLGRIIKRKGNFQKKKRFKHFDIFHGPLKIPGYAVRFCIGNFWKFKPEFLVKWKALLITVTMNVRL